MNLSVTNITSFLSPNLISMIFQALDLVSVLDLLVLAIAYCSLMTLDPSKASHFIVTILIKRGAFCVPSKVSRETL